MKTKIWLGLNGTIKGDAPRQIFRDAETPSPDRYSFAAVIGPFRTMRGAIFMRDHGRGNPHCQCVADAERLAAIYAGQSELCAARIRHLDNEIAASRRG